MPKSVTFQIRFMTSQSRRQSSRLRGASHLSGGAKFKIKHKSRCLQKSKTVNWGARPPLGAGPVTSKRQLDTDLTVLVGQKNKMLFLLFKLQFIFGRNRLW